VVRRRAWQHGLGQLTSSALVGFSYSYWMHTHPAHHQHPSTEQVDPDIESLGYAFYEGAARRARGLQRVAVRLQPWSVLAGFVFWGAAVKWDSLQHVRRHFGRRTAVDAGCLVLHFCLWLGLPMLVRGPAAACLDYAGILALKGLYMGAILVVPHMGLGTRTLSQRLSFFERQVRFSRNHEGPFGWTLFCGGLNLQIEHHLLPHVACVRLPRAQPIVERHCRRHGIPYRHTGYLQAWAEVLAHLRRMGEIATAPVASLTPSRTRTSAEELPARHPR
jgi:fatty acid desaturase